MTKFQLQGAAFISVVPYKALLISKYWLWGHLTPLVSICQTILDKMISKNVVLIFNLTSAEVILQIQSEIRWAHSSILVSFLCQSSLSQWEFLNIFYIFVILRYDIYNKISKFGHFGHFYFWPLLASFRGHWKRFLLKVT